MRSDPVSELLRLVEATCTLTGGLRAGGAWSYRFAPDAAVKLDLVTRGSCWLIADDADPLQLGAGDAVVLNGVGDAVLCSDPALTPGHLSAAERGDGFFASLGTGTDVVVLGGHVSVDPAYADLFASALPRVLAAPARTEPATEMRRLLEGVVEESEAGRPGAAFATDQYAQLLLLQVLRAAIEDGSEIGPGWLRLHTDQRLAPAVSALHADPSRAWSVAELAAEAAMSRSQFSLRFRELSGLPPLTYLSHWRISLAQRELRSGDATVAAIGSRLGYASESSFSHAFQRVAGTSPARYRHALRA